MHLCVQRHPGCPVLSQFWEILPLKQLRPFEGRQIRLKPFSLLLLLLLSLLLLLYGQPLSSSLKTGNFQGILT